MYHNKVPYFFYLTHCRLLGQMVSPYFDTSVPISTMGERLCMHTRVATANLSQARSNILSQKFLTGCFLWESMETQNLGTDHTLPSLPAVAALHTVHNTTAPPRIPSYNPETSAIPNSSNGLKTKQRSTIRRNYQGSKRPKSSTGVKESKF